MSDEVPVADHFYTLQGEGVSTGKPAYFLRTQGCNFSCGLDSLADVPQDERGDYDDVKEYEAEEASWICDTMHESEGGWLSGEAYGQDELVSAMEHEHDDIFNKLYNDQAHLVITGGEPLLHQDELSSFLEYIGAEDIYVEVETNASIEPADEFDALVDQYNTSPKLSNSGMPEEKRFNDDAIEFFKDREDAYFKFVTSGPEDTDEILDEWVEEYDLPGEKVLLMPAGANQEELQETKMRVAELAKEHGFRYTDRVHINIWDEMVSV